MWWAVGILALLLAGTAGGLWCLYVRIFYHRGARPRHPRPATLRPKAKTPPAADAADEMNMLPHEWVYTNSYDGLRLAARLYPGRDSAPVMILFHGYKSEGHRDVAGGFRVARENGYAILLVDQRAHGKSEGHTIAFGIKERRDCLSWIRFAVSRFGSSAKIVLFGVSMGAASVLMATELLLPRNVRAVVADCPYDAPMEILRKVCRDRKWPDRLMMPLIRAAAYIYGAVALQNSCTAVKAVLHSRVPILLLHGEEDRFVPPAMSRAIYEAIPGEKERITFPGAGHARSYETDRAGYTAAVTAFLQRFL